MCSNNIRTSYLSNQGNEGGPVSFDGLVEHKGGAIMRVYIAGPYGRRKGATAGLRLMNVYTAILAARELIKLGHIPFVPHLYHYVHEDWQDSPDEDVWLAIGKAWLPFCEAILLLPGWEDSHGSLEELAEAERRNSIVFKSIKEARQWRS